MSASLARNESVGQLLKLASMSRCYMVHQWVRVDLRLPRTKLATALKLAWVDLVLPCPAVVKK